MQKHSNSKAEEAGGLIEPFTRLGGEIRQAGQQVSDAATGAVEDITKMGSEKISELRDTGEEYLSDVEKYVKANPVRSVCVSAQLRQGILMNFGTGFS